MGKREKRVQYVERKRRMKRRQFSHENERIRASNGLVFYRQTFEK